MRQTKGFREIRERELALARPGKRRPGYRQVSLQNSARGAGGVRVGRFEGASFEQIGAAIDAARGPTVVGYGSNVAWKI